MIPKLTVKSISNFYYYKTKFFLNFFLRALLLFFMFAAFASCNKHPQIKKENSKLLNLLAYAGYVQDLLLYDSQRLSELLDEYEIVHSKKNKKKSIELYQRILRKSSFVKESEDLERSWLKLYKEKFDLKTFYRTLDDDDQKFFLYVLQRRSAAIYTLARGLYLDKSPQFLQVWEKLDLSAIFPKPAKAN